jgi:hypothetical protein
MNSLYQLLSTMHRSYSTEERDGIYDCLALYNRAETFVSCLATLNQLPKYMETECTTFYVEKRLWTFS